MCLGIPGKIVEINEVDNLLMGKIDFGGVTREVCLSYIPEVEIGDYAIVHVGFAISRLDEESAMETLAMFEELGILYEELGLEEPDEAAVISLDESAPPEAPPN
jgi:hydrogenase expression/formation protein HypC